METQFAQMASLIGEPVRAKILWLLLDGRAYTATELALGADTSPQNISMHVTKLIQASLLSVESQGRHRYYRISREEVAYAIEAMAGLLSAKQAAKPTNNTGDTGIKYCRTCYDHLAGKAGVLLTESLQKQKIIQPAGEVYELTKKGKLFFQQLDIDIEALQKQRRTFAKPCLDWSERKHHLAGSLGAAMLDKMLQSDWVRRTRNSRAVIITASGRKEWNKLLNINL